MTSLELSTLMTAIAPVIREYVDKTVAERLAPEVAYAKALELRLLELETRPTVVGPAGAKGDPGLTGESGPVGPAGVKGDPGVAGSPGPIGIGVADALLDRDGHLLLTFSDGRTKDVGLVIGKDGAPGLHGKDGVNGLDGKDGAPGLDGKDGARGLDGKDGAPGLNGKDGRDGLHGKDGADGLDGKDGAAGLHGKDGINGRDGADGMTLDDAELVCESDGWVLRLSAGGRTKDCPLAIPFDVGPWAAGTTYPAGAGVSWDGGYWIAKRMTNEQPGPGDAWRLAVRRGKQGKEGQRGKDGADFRPGNTPPLY